MTIFFWLFANGLAAFLDFSAGTFVVFIASRVTDHQFLFYHYLFGGGLALIPDFIVFYLWSRYGGKITTDIHKTITHRPLVVLPIVFASAWLIDGQFWAITATLCTLCHFLHDFPVINWFWPFSQDKKGFYRDTSKEGISREHENWLYQTWLEGSRRAEIEIQIGAVLLAIVSIDILKVFGTLFAVVSAGFFVYIFLQVIQIIQAVYRLKKRDL